MGCLFICILAVIVYGEKGKVYLVIGSDTAIWDGLSLTQYTDRYFNGALYTDPTGNAHIVMNSSFRDQFRDSYGTPMKMTWWMMAGNVFHLSNNCNIPIRNNITLHLMKKYHLDAIQKYDDQLSLHYHNYYWSDTNGDGIYYWNQGLDFSLNLEDYEECLMKYLIEEDVFPVSFRSGWHYMDNAWQAYQERFIPFDMSNAYPAQGGDYNEPTNNIIDWSQSPAAFVPYHPNAENYQIEGDLKQWRLRSICFTSIASTRQNLNIMFQEAAGGKNQMVCLWSHLPQTDFMLGLDSVNAIAHRLSAKYNVDFIYCRDTEAMRLWINPADTVAPVLTINEIIENDTRRFSIETDGPIFQEDEPFVAMKTKYETYKRLSCVVTGKNRWETVTPMPLEIIAKVAVAVCDSVGNQTKAHLSYVPDDIFIDNHDPEFQEIAGTWNNYTEGELWNLDARLLSGIGSVNIKPSIQETGRYNVLFHGPASTSDSVRYALTNGTNNDTILYTETLAGSNQWQHIGFFDLNSGNGNVLTVENLRQNAQLGIDVIRFTPLIADRKMILDKTRIDFGDVSITDSIYQYLKISNHGQYDLEIQAIHHDGDKITIDQTVPVTIKPMKTMILPILFTSEHFCEYNDNIQIHSNDILNPVVNIPVSASALSYFKIIDNDGGVGYRESNHAWFTSVATAYGATSRCVYINGNVGAYADYDKILSISGEYDIQFIVPKTENATNNACYVIYIKGVPVDSVYIDQNQNSGTFVSIGYYNLPANTTIKVRCAYFGGNTYSKGFVLRADAIKYLLIEQKEVGDIADMIIPLNFSVDQNYPNPFNSKTIINYTINNTDNVTLSIYDLQGRLIDEWFFTNQPPGKYSLLWEARTNSSGLYIYVLSNRTQKLKRKMLLIK